MYDCYKMPVNRRLSGYTDMWMIDLPIARFVARYEMQTNSYLQVAWREARQRLMLDYMPVENALRIRAIELVIADRTMCDNG